MAYVKFDAPKLSVDDSRRKVYGAFPSDAIRRALQGIANKVIGSTSGTASHLLLAGATTGTTCGVNVANTIVVLINGQYSTCIAQDNLRMPTGTMGTNTVGKFLVSTGAGTSGTITGPGNVIDKGLYANATTAAAFAKLPDLPDGHCALSILTLHAPEVTAITALGSGTLGTMGTASLTDLVSMPYDGT